MTLLAALLAEREREVTDSLVDLLIATVHRIGARAERKVTEELVNAFRRVTGKENILFAIAEASLARPAGAVREVVYPAVRGGEQTLRELVHEYKTKGPVYRRTVQTTLKASYTNHYRKGLVDLLDVLEFRSTNTAHQPVIEALKLIARYARAGNLTYYPAGETAPAHRETTGEWADLVYRPDKHGRRRWSAWFMRSPPSRRCASSCAARRSGSSAPGGGALAGRASGRLAVSQRTCLGQQCLALSDEAAGHGHVDRPAGEGRAKQQTAHPAGDGIARPSQPRQQALGRRVAVRGAAGQRTGGGSQGGQSEGADRRLQPGVDPAEPQQYRPVRPHARGRAEWAMISPSTRSSGA